MDQSVRAVVPSDWTSYGKRVASDLISIIYYMDWEM